jgi:hypothetical protein
MHQFRWWDLEVWFREEAPVAAVCRLSVKDPPTALVEFGRLVPEGPGVAVVRRLSLNQLRWWDLPFPFANTNHSSANH